MASTRKVSVTCEECGSAFCYSTKAYILKTFCGACSKRRIDESKRRSKEKRAGREEDDDLTDAEIEAKLEAIPDREVSWERFFNHYGKQAT